MLGGLGPAATGRAPGYAGADPHRDERADDGRRSAASLGAPFRTATSTPTTTLTPTHDDLHSQRHAHAGAAHRYAFDHPDRH